MFLIFIYLQFTRWGYVTPMKKPIIRKWYTCSIHNIDKVNKKSWLIAPGKSCHLELKIFMYNLYNLCKYHGNMKLEFPTEPAII